MKDSRDLLIALNELFSIEQMKIIAAFAAVCGKSHSDFGVISSVPNVQ